jgi:predicted nucleotidyltransferase
MTLNDIEIPRERIASFCRDRGILRLSLFGSILRSDFGPASDIDVLVEFQPGVRVGLSFARMQNELSEIFGRKVDLNTPGFLSAYFREEIIKEAVVQYDAA